MVFTHKSNVIKPHNKVNSRCEQELKKVMYRYDNNF